MKYIMFEQTVGDKNKKKTTRHVPFIFPDSLVHIEVATLIEPLLLEIPGSKVKIRSAGEINVHGVCHGWSATLKKTAHEDDTIIITTYNYTHGIIS